jgi:hypothetical protein
MTQCPTCGQWIKNERYKLEANVFVWTVMTVLVWGMVLFTSEWTVAWFSARAHMLIMFAAIPVAAVYFWIRLLRERGRK